MRITEDFKSISKTVTFKEGEPCTLPSGLVVELLPGDAVKKPKALRRPSGFLEASGKNPGDAEAKKLFGKMELVVGDACDVKVTFPGQGRLLGVVYYQLLDYTTEDISFSRKQTKELTYKEKCFAIGFCYKSAPYSPVLAYPAFGEVSNSNNDNDQSTHVIFENILIGSLHIGQISWEPLPSA